MVPLAFDEMEMSGSSGYEHYYRQNIADSPQALTLTLTLTLILTLTLTLTLTLPLALTPAQILTCSRSRAMARGASTAAPKGAVT